MMMILMKSNTAQKEMKVLMGIRRNQMMMSTTAKMT